MVNNDNKITATYPVDEKKSRTLFDITNDPNFKFGDEFNQRYFSNLPELDITTDPVTGEVVSGGAGSSTGYDKLQKDWDEYKKNPEEFWNKEVKTGLVLSDKDAINTMGSIGEVYKQGIFGKYNKRNFDLENLEGTITDIDIEDRAFNKNLPKGEDKSLNARRAATIGIARGVHQDVKNADNYIGIKDGEGINLEKVNNRIGEMTKNLDLKTEEGRNNQYQIELEYARLLMKRGIPFNSGQGNTKTIDGKSLKAMGFKYATNVFNQLYNEQNSDEVVGGV